MSNSRNTGFLTNVIKVDATGNVSFVSGSTTLATISTSGQMSGSLPALSSSYALSASYVTNAETLDGLDSTVFTLTSSFNTTSASLYTVSSSAYATSGSLSATSGSLSATSGSLSATSGSLSAASGSLSAASGSFNTRVTALEITGSALSSSILSVSASSYLTSGSLSSASGSFNSRVATVESKYATTGSNTFIGTQTISGSVLQSGSFTSTGTLTAQTLVVQTITSSVVYSSGSNIFGNAIANTQTFTGSMFITGSSIIANIGAACFSGTVCNSNTVINGSVSTPLSLTGTNTVTTLNINNINASSWGGGISVQTNTTSSFYLQTLGSLLGSTNQDATLWATAGNGVRIYTNGNNLRLNIDSTGVATFTCQVCTAGLRTTDSIVLLKNAATDNRYLQFCDTNTSGYRYDFILQSTAQGCGFGLYNNTTACWGWYLAPNGNVGINTTSLSYPLTRNGMTIKAATNDGVEFVMLSCADTGFLGGALVRNGSDFGFINRTSGNIIFATNAVERMYITNAGNVGIGTSSPFAIADINLSINGTTSSAIQLGVASTRTGQLYASAGEVRLSAVTSIPLNFYTNDLKRMAIDASGVACFYNTMCVPKMAINGYGGLCTHFLSGFFVANSGTTTYCIASVSTGAYSVAVAHIDWEATYAIASNNMTIGYTVAGTRRGTSDTTWVNSSCSILNLGDVPSSPTFFWNGGYLQVTVPTYDGVYANIRITNYGNTFTPLI